VKQNNATPLDVLSNPKKLKLVALTRPSCRARSTTW
jgi:ABC-type metal ion transport system substrate-binding protein